MKKIRYSIAGILLFCLTSMFASGPAPVFITAGQSNADGRETIDKLPSYLRGGYQYLHYANVTKDCDGRFSEFEFGPRFAFCDFTNYYLNQALGSDFYAIKCAYGGTSITPGATYDHLPVWYAESSWIASNKPYRGDINEGKSLTLALTEGFKTLAERTLSKLPEGYDVKAIMWHQGESDRKKAGEYEKSFAEMITFMRREIYSVTGDEADLTLPFIFGTVSHASKQYNAVVEEAQLKVARELPNVYVIDLSDAGLKSDQLHFDGAWTEYLGKQMFNKLIELNLVNGDVVTCEKP